MKHLDPRSPLVFDTKELSRRPGSMLETTRRVAAPSELGTEVVAVPAGEEMDLDLRAESVLEGVLVTGSVRASAHGTCVRCLDPLTREVRASFQELFVHAERAAHHRKTGAVDEDSDERFVEDDLIDLEPVLLDTVVPALPFQPVCRADCPGLCPQCGFRLADDPAHAHELLDPRWASLAKFSPTQPDADN